MAFFSLFRPKWKHSDPGKREDAVEQLDDQVLLESIAQNDDCWPVRAAAIKRLTNQELIKKIGKTDEEQYIRMEAVGRIADPAYLMNVARNDSSELVQQAAVARMHNEGFLKEIATSDKSSLVRREAIGKLRDANLLAQLADDSDDSVRTRADDRLEAYKLVGKNWDALDKRLNQYESSRTLCLRVNESSLAEIEDLLLNANVNWQQEWDGNSAMHTVSQVDFGCTNEDEALAKAKLLLQNGACLTIENANGQQPIHIAAMRGHSKLLRYYLQHRTVDPNRRASDGCTPLHLVAISDTIESRGEDRCRAAKVLLENDADPSIMSRAHGTPIDIAVRKKRKKLARLLKKS